MSVVFNRGLLNLNPATWAADDIRALLTTVSYTPDKDHNFVSDVTNELVATNYVRKVLASKTVTEDDTNDRLVYDAADLLWTALGTSSPTQIVLFKFVTVDADSPLIAVFDIVNASPADGSDYPLAWPTAGIFRVQQA